MFQKTHSRECKDGRVLAHSLETDPHGFCVFCSPRARKEYWENLQIASGRPYNPSMSKPDAWGVTKGTAELMQQKEATTEQQLRELFKKQELRSAQ